MIIEQLHSQKSQDKDFSKFGVIYHHIMYCTEFFFFVFPQKYYRTNPMCNPVVPLPYFNEEGKCWWSFPLKNTFPALSSSSFLITDGYRFYSSNL